MPWIILPFLLRLARTDVDYNYCFIIEILGVLLQLILFSSLRSLLLWLFSVIFGSLDKQYCFCILSLFSWSTAKALFFLFLLVDVINLFLVLVTTSVFPQFDQCFRRVYFVGRLSATLKEVGRLRSEKAELEERLTVLQKRRYSVTDVYVTVLFDATCRYRALMQLSCP